MDNDSAKDRTIKLGWIMTVPRIGHIIRMDTDSAKDRTIKLGSIMTVPRIGQ